MISLPLASIYNAGPQALPVAGGGLCLFQIIARNVVASGTSGSVVDLSWTEAGNPETYNPISVSTQTRDFNGPFSFAPDLGTTVYIEASGPGSVSAGALEIYIGRIKEEQ